VRLDAAARGGGWAARRGADRGCGAGRADRGCGGGGQGLLRGGLRGDERS